MGITANAATLPRKTALNEERVDCIRNSPLIRIAANFRPRRTTSGLVLFQPGDALVIIA
jgi:hypothetical protein